MYTDDTLPGRHYTLKFLFTLFVDVLILSSTHYHAEYYINAYRSLYCIYILNNYVLKNNVSKQRRITFISVFVANYIKSLK